MNEDTTERRRFLGRAVKITLAVPPTMALLLSAEGRHYALAQSGGSRGNNGRGNGNNGRSDGNNGGGNRGD